MKVNIGKAARELGVSRDTLRRWESEGRISVDRAANGRRRYDLDELTDLLPRDSGRPRITVGYARAGEDAPDDSLERQRALLESYCAVKSWKHEIVSDISSGMNMRSDGLRNLIRRICAGEVDRLVVSSVNRLPRIGAELIFALCEQFGTEVVVVNASRDTDSSDELSEDVIELVSVFSSRLYDGLSSDRSNVMALLRKVSEDLRSN
jgi:predicted site-specific integrase-resolvase